MKRVVAKHSLFVFVCTCIRLTKNDTTLSSFLLLGCRHGDMACGCSPGQLTPVQPPRLHVYRSESCVLCACSRCHPLRGRLFSDFIMFFRHVIQLVKNAL